jgi:peptidoglycan L-alanyl-D-glutamate endopeptidase CwlK
LNIGVFDKKDYLGESPLYKAVAVLGKQLGLSWGGDWKSRKDEPHYELRPHWAINLSENAMLAKIRARGESRKPLFA